MRAVAMMDFQQVNVVFPFAVPVDLEETFAVDWSYLLVLKAALLFGKLFPVLRIRSHFLEFHSYYLSYEGYLS